VLKKLQNVVALAMSMPRGSASTARRRSRLGMDGRLRIGMDLVASMGDRSGSFAHFMGPDRNSDVIRMAIEKSRLNVGTGRVLKVLKALKLS